MKHPVKRSLLLTGLPGVLLFGSLTFFGANENRAAFPAAILLSFALGTVIAFAALPFDGHGRILVLHSTAHFLLTGGLALTWTWVCWYVKEPSAFVVLFALYTFVYLVIWLVRYMGWRFPEREASPWKWHENLPYLFLLAVGFLFLRPLLQPLDARDVPVLCGLLLPYFGYPILALVIGFAAGLRTGWSVLPSMTVFLAFLPNLLWQSVPYHWSMGALYAGLTAAAGLIGTLACRWRGKEEKKV